MLLFRILFVEGGQHRLGDVACHRLPDVEETVVLALSSGAKNGGELQQPAGVGSGVRALKRLVEVHDVCEFADNRRVVQVKHVVDLLTLVCGTCGAKAQEAKCFLHVIRHPHAVAEEWYHLVLHVLEQIVHRFVTGCCLLRAQCLQTALGCLA